MSGAARRDIQAGFTRHLTSTTPVKFEGVIDPANVENADLTLLYLTGSPGEPDYLEFNGHGIGGDDVANGGNGKTPYVDFKTFDVTKYIQAENSVLFLRGKDINGDGKIVKILTPVAENGKAKKEGVSSAIRFPWR